MAKLLNYLASIFLFSVIFLNEDERRCCWKERAQCPGLEPAAPLSLGVAEEPGPLPPLTQLPFCLGERVSC